VLDTTEESVPPEVVFSQQILPGAPPLAVSTADEQKVPEAGETVTAAGTGLTTTRPVAQVVVLQPLYLT
jgi:hypothetical protein